MSDAIISLAGVNHFYNPSTPIEKHVLRNVHLDIASGEIIGIIGRPGSGKTTLAKIMAGLLSPTSGSVVSPGAGPGKTGLLFQFPEHQLFADNVYHDITYSLKEILHLPDHEIESVFQASCKKVALEPFIIRDLHRSALSDGEKRKVAIAAILAISPEVLIFDEPTAGLDYTGRSAILGEIRNLHKYGKTIIVISHDLEELLHFSERMIYIGEGEILLDGRPIDILEELAGQESNLAMLPKITEFLARLKLNGLDVKTGMVDPDEAFEEIKRAMNNRKKD